LLPVLSCGYLLCIFPNQIIYQIKGEFRFFDFAVGLYHVGRAENQAALFEKIYNPSYLVFEILIIPEAYCGLNVETAHYHKIFFVFREIIIIKIYKIPNKNAFSRVYIVNGVQKIQLKKKVVF